MEILFAVQEELYSIFTYMKFGQDSKDLHGNIANFIPSYYPAIMDRKSAGKKILTKFLQILSPSLHFDSL